MAITSTDFWDKTAQRYSQQAIADPDTYARKLAATQALMQPDMQVLELGCGTGSTALEHAAHVAHITASDISPAMIAIARDKAKQQGVNNIDFQAASIDSFDAPENSFDMILALNLLHLVPDRAAALQNIQRLLKPGGLFISSTACLADRMWYLRPVIKIMQWLNKAPAVSFSKQKDFLAEVSDAGFDIQQQWSHGQANCVFLVARKLDS
ncbi:SAM-dependent methyltransferase [Bacterioplanes sanyensis]|uniref:SAM-dependent methyltransferase n=1 Tax=Bacterioplanes sanyensis TaxID=1249553 RepID=A0A222FGT5_9GAMM|nr:class I SAM-dependent methyltransferase [Bacterioplanes sanyensis]ASP37832.1 SAM-dependent methyltransferase [Bacterioplanes sanyensis]